MEPFFATMVSTQEYIYHQERPEEKTLRNLASLMCDLHLSNFKAELEKLITKLCQEAEKVKGDSWRAIIQGILKHLIQLWQQHKITTTNSPFRGLFQSILKIYLQHYVGYEPEADSWVRKKIACPSAENGKSCKLCIQLNEYLCDPEKLNFRFTHAPQNRDHVEEVLRNVESPAGWRSYYTRQSSRIDKVELNIHKFWEYRFNRAKEEIDDLGLDILKDLLGESYDSIINLSLVKRNTPAVAEQSQSASA